MSTQGGDAPGAGIERWAVVAVAAHAVLMVLSYGLAPFAPHNAAIPERIRVLASVAAWIRGATGLGFEAFVAGRGFLAGEMARGIAYLAPIAAATLAALAVLRLVTRKDVVIDRGVLDRLQHAALAFAAVNVLRFPIFTNDFWMSIAWGRMELAGVNPYYHDFTPASLEGLAVQYFPQHMTYGPLWAVVCWVLALLTGRSVVAAFLLHKLVIGAAWLAMVAVVRRVAEARSPREAAVALCLAGWLPASVGLTIGEGHNDALLALGVALFLWLGTTSRPVTSWLALTGSVLVKYSSAPLAGLGLLHAFRPGGPRGRIVPALLLSVGLAAACFALFWRGAGFFDAATEMRAWRFLNPASAVGYALNRLGLPAPPRALDAALFITLIAFVVLALRDYLRARDVASYSAAALAIMAVVVFSLVGHVWPWFALWLVPPVALATRGALARWIVWVLVGLPVLDLGWMIRPNWSFLEPLGVVVFGSATVLALTLRPWHALSE